MRVTTEGTAQQAQGYVVTFDDITELVSAQRSTAWADVARRIAHEIKNPLTPIQLSAERIRRKYGDSITKDRDVFDQCTDTIIRQVSDIGRMVDEFSAFARMPKPVMELNDIREIVREAVFLFQVSRPEITFELDLPEKPAVMLSDRRLLTQAVTNLVKNASEAIDTAMEAEPERTEKGHVIAKVRTKGDRLQITVIDNGCGLPKENRQRLVEPYMTTRAKGTGLGLGDRAPHHRAAWRKLAACRRASSGTARFREPRCAWTSRSGRSTRCSRRPKRMPGTAPGDEAKTPEAAE